MKILIGNFPPNLFVFDLKKEMPETYKKMIKKLTITPRQRLKKGSKLKK